MKKTVNLQDLQNTEEDQLREIIKHIVSINPSLLPLLEEEINEIKNHPQDRLPRHLPKTTEEERYLSFKEKMRLFKTLQETQDFQTQTPRTLPIKRFHPMTSRDENIFD